MKPAPHRPLWLNDLEIHIPLERPRNSPRVYIFTTLAVLFVAGVSLFGMAH